MSRTSVNLHVHRLWTTQGFSAFWLPSKSVSSRHEFTSLLNGFFYWFESHSRPFFCGMLSESDVTRMFFIRGDQASRHPAFQLKRNFPFFRITFTDSRAVINTHAANHPTFSIERRLKSARRPWRKRSLLNRSSSVHEPRRCLRKIERWERWSVIVLLISVARIEIEKQLLIYYQLVAVLMETPWQKYGRSD